MNRGNTEVGARDVAARSQHLEREAAAARRLLASGTSEVEEVLETVAKRLAEEVQARSEEVPRPGAGQEPASGAAPPGARGGADAEATPA
jgi:hypothetical protein